MADPGVSETAGDEPLPYHTHTPAPLLLCTVQSANIQAHLLENIEDITQEVQGLYPQ